MANPNAMLTQALHVTVREVDAMRQPCAGVQPTHILKIVDGAHAKCRMAEFILVMGFRKMGMEAAIMLFRQFAAGAHEGLGNTERRARRKGNMDRRTLTPLVVLPDHPLAISQNIILILHNGIGRQAAVLFGQVHRPARHRHPHAKPARLGHLDIHCVFEAGGEEVVMVRGCGDTRHQKFRQREAG